MLQQAMLYRRRIIQYPFLYKSMLLVHGGLHCYANANWFTIYFFRSKVIGDTRSGKSRHIISYSLCTVIYYFKILELEFPAFSPEYDTAAIASLGQGSNAKSLYCCQQV